jgi:hypothetical protein
MRPKKKQQVWHDKDSSLLKDLGRRKYILQPFAGNGDISPYKLKIPELDVKQ